MSSECNTKNWFSHLLEGRFCVLHETFDFLSFCPDMSISHAQYYTYVYSTNIEKHIQNILKFLFKVDRQCLYSVLRERDGGFHLMLRSYGKWNISAGEMYSGISIGTRIQSNVTLIPTTLYIRGSTLCAPISTENRLNIALRDRRGK